MKKGENKKPDTHSLRTACPTCGRLLPKRVRKSKKAKAANGEEGEEKEGENGGKAGT